MKHIYKCLLIGLGHRAVDDHLPALVPNALGIELVGVCDKDSTKKGILKKIFSEKNITPPNFYTDLIKACREIKPDFAIIATPHNTHLQIVKTLLDFKIPFLKEKPFTRSLKEAYLLKKMVDESKGYMRLCVQRRCHPLYVYGKKALANLGNIRHFEAHYQLHLDKPCDGWRSAIGQAGGGCIIDMGYHYFDLLYWYFGRPDNIFSVVAPKNSGGRSYPIEETALVSLKYGNGVAGNLFISRCEPRKFEELLVYGKYGYIQLQRDFLKRFDVDDQLLESLTRTPAWPSAVSDVLADFIANMDNFKITKKECEDGLEIMKIIDAIYRSIKEKKSILIK